VERLKNGTGLTTEPTRDRDDNINVTKRNYMNTTDNNLALLQDLYLCVWAARPKNMDNLMIFLDQLIEMEEDVWDIDDLHDPEFKLRSHLNG
jgi:hypothetical protein